ncbi:hypothetical protein ATANTOWER_017781 [Ataeniobius toweri]|uniref:Uncharacterized protein n=1 Tax=Ataeniobius toweri TaxID=208326 RepID=A0ABU7AYE7_9TELE|nr:hypothetical protein [Ataeniobius toweri]
MTWHFHKAHHNIILQHTQTRNSGAYKLRQHGKQLCHFEVHQGQEIQHTKRTTKTLGYMVTIDKTTQIQSSSAPRIGSDHFDIHFIYFKSVAFKCGKTGTAAHMFTNKISI